MSYSLEEYIKHLEDTIETLEKQLGEAIGLLNDLQKMAQGVKE